MLILLYLVDSARLQIEPLYQSYISLHETKYFLEINQ